MVSKRTNFEKAEQSNSSIKLTDTSNTEVNNINLLINKLPLIIFRASGKLSWGMDYLSSNVEELTGYSRMDFIDQKLHTLSK